MMKLISNLSTNKNTEVFHEEIEEMKYKAPHYFAVLKKACGDKTIIATIKFQEGPIGECGVNGVMNEDLIAMVISRLQYFQKTDYCCKENAMAITKLEEAMLWMGLRTRERESRGVEGTNKI
jgi:hypothetical protein